MALTEEQGAKLNEKSAQKKTEVDTAEYQEFLRFKAMKAQQDQVSEEQTATKFCKYCGSIIDINEQTCPACGKQLNVVNPLPIAESEEDDNWVYDKDDVSFITLAFVPLLGIVLSHLGVGSTAVIIISIICNTILLAIDVSLLRRYDELKNQWWLWMGFIFVPVYMFLRVSRTTKQYWPAIVWCACFVLDLVL